MQVNQDQLWTCDYQELWNTVVIIVLTKIASYKLNLPILVPIEKNVVG